MEAAKRPVLPAKYVRKADANPIVYPANPSATTPVSTRRSIATIAELVTTLALQEQAANKASVSVQPTGQPVTMYVSIHPVTPAIVGVVVRHVQPVNVATMDPASFVPVHRRSVALTAAPSPLPAATTKPA